MTQFPFPPRASLQCKPAEAAPMPASDCALQAIPFPERPNFRSTSSRICVAILAAFWAIVRWPFRGRRPRPLWSFYADLWENNPNQLSA